MMALKFCTVAIPKVMASSPYSKRNEKERLAPTYTEFSIPLEALPSIILLGLYSVARNKEGDKASP